MNDQPAENTDRELYREDTGEVPGSYYENYIFVTKQGAIGMDVGGRVFVKPIADWHKLAEGNGLAAPEPLATTDAANPPEAIEDKLRRQIDILIQHYGAEAKGHLYSKRKAIREPYLDKIMAIITTETTNARIDELKHITGFSNVGGVYTNAAGGDTEPIKDRIHALQKEQP